MDELLFLELFNNLTYESVFTLGIRGIMTLEDRGFTFEIVNGGDCAFVNASYNGVFFETYRLNIDVYRILSKNKDKILQDTLDMKKDRLEYHLETFRKH